MAETMMPFGEARTAAGQHGPRGGRPEPAPVIATNTTRPDQPASLLEQVGDYLLSSPYGSQVPELEFPITRADIQTVTDSLQRHVRPIVAGTLVSATLANSAPAISTASAMPAEGRGNTAAHVYEKRPNRAIQEDKVVHMTPGDTINNEAAHEARHLGVSVATEAGQIEAESDITPDQVTDLPVGTELKIPRDRDIAVVPAGEGRDQVAKEHGITPEQIEALNPTADPDFVAVGAHLRIRPAKAKSGKTPTKTVQPQAAELPGPVTSHSKASPKTSSPKPARIKRSTVQTRPAHMKLPAAVAPETEQQQSLPGPQTHAARRRKAAAPKSSDQQVQEHQTVLSAPSTQAAKQKAAAPKAPAKPSLVPKAPVAPADIISAPLLPIIQLSPFHDSPAPNAAKAASVPKQPTRAERPPQVAHSEAQPIKTDYGIQSDMLSKSGLSVQALHQALQQTYPHMADLAGDFHKLEQRYGINALYAAAAAAQESAGATSSLAQDRNNLFGVNAVDSDPNQAFGYKSMADSVNAFGDLLVKRYLHKGGEFFNGSSLHGIYKDYSTSHDTEAGEIASIMNTLAGHGKTFHEAHRARIPKAHTRTGHRFAKDSQGLFRALGHAWGEAGSTVTSGLHNPIERIWHDAQSAADAVPGHDSHNRVKHHSHHTLGNAAIYYAALRFDSASYPPTSEQAMSAGHDGVSAWHKTFPYVGPKALLDCSGLVNLAVSTATGGQVNLSENTVTEREDHHYWQQIPFSQAQRGDLIEPVIDGQVGDHVEIVDEKAGTTIDTFGSHTSHASQPDQISPTKYQEDKRDIFLRYVGPGAPLGNHIRPQASSYTGWGTPGNLKSQSQISHKNTPTKPASLRQQFGKW